jgi:hypothetical protein
MEDELYAVAGLQPEGDAVVAIDAEAGRVPLDLFGDPGVRTRWSPAPLPPHLSGCA